MKLKNLTIKTIPYIATLTLVFGMTGCSGSDNNKENNATTEYTTSAQGENETTMNVAGNDNVGSGNEADTTGGDAVGGGEQDTTSGSSNNTSSGNAGNNSSNGGTGSSNSSGTGKPSVNKPTNNSGSSGNSNAGSSNNSGTVSKPSGNGSGISGNAGSSNNSGSGSGNNSSGSSSNNNGSSSNGSSSSGSAAKFVETKSETTYKYASTKVDSYTTKYTTTEVFTVYDLYSDGSKVYDGYEFMCSEKEVGTLTVMVKNNSTFTDVKMKLNVNSGFEVADMKDTLNTHNKWKVDDFYVKKTNDGSVAECNYVIRTSDGEMFSDEKVMLGDNAARALVKELGLDNKSISKEKRLFTLLKWMEDNVTYTMGHHSTYDCLIENVAVCEGYANAICHILSYTDIPVKYASSFSYNHAWNIVQLDDGCWYEIDGTPGITYDYGSSQKYLMYYFNHLNVNDIRINEYDIKHGMHDSTLYTKTINYVNPATINSKFPLINDYGAKYWVNIIFIKAEDITH